MATVQSPDLRESFRICRAELQHEYGVLSSRLTAYIMSQAFLVSAFAVAMNNTDIAWGARYRLMIPLLLAIVGLSLSARAFPGIAGVCQIIERWHTRQKELFDASTHELDDWDVLRRPTVATINERNLWFAKTSAWIFGIAWALMGCVVLWAYRTGL